MAGLEGTVNTPLGAVPKKTAVLIGGGAVILAGIVWYRHKNAAPSTTTADPNAEIDPATGYPYGSPEDAAALQAQSSYVSASPPASGGGGSSVPPTGTGYVSNGAWTQGVIEYLTSTSAVADPSALSAALGKYVTGAYVAPGSSDDTLIMQAIAAQGYPPVSGPNGMPPAINRNPPQGSTGGSTASSTAAPTGLRVISASKTALTISWNSVAGAKGYQTFINGHGHGTTYYNGITETNLKPNTRYTIGVKTVNNEGKVGPMATFVASTSK